MKIYWYMVWSEQHIEPSFPILNAQSKYILWLENTVFIFKCFFTINGIRQAVAFLLLNLSDFRISWNKLYTYQTQTSLANWIWWRQIPDIHQKLTNYIRYNHTGMHGKHRNFHHTKLGCDIKMKYQMDMKFSGKKWERVSGLTCPTYNKFFCHTQGSSFVPVKIRLQIIFWYMR